MVGLSLCITKLLGYANITRVVTTNHCQILIANAIALHRGKKWWQILLGPLIRSRLFEIIDSLLRRFGDFMDCGIAGLTLQRYSSRHHHY